MFYARVMVGNYKELPSNKDIKMPPEGYDSIKGFTNGSDVYMVYANKKTYPEYLITYTN